MVKNTQRALVHFTLKLIIQPSEKKGANFVENNLVPGLRNMFHAGEKKKIEK